MRSTKKLEFPRRLTSRDPRNKLDVQTAMFIINELARCYITSTTKAELKQVNFNAQSTLFGPLKTLRNVPKDAVIIGNILDPLRLQPQLVPSVIATCENCGVLLAVSKANKSNDLTCLCCFCVADRVLAEYWTEQDKKRN